MAERRVGEDLEQAWEAIRRGEAPSAALDPWLIETLRAVHDRDRVPPLDPAFVQELRDELMAATAVPTAATVADLPLPNGRVVPAPWASTRSAGSTPSRPRRWALSHLATAALVLLVVVGSVVGFGLHRLDRPKQEPAILPGISGTSATPEGVATETLLDTTIGTLPPRPGIIVFKRLTLQPSPKSLVVLPLTGPVILLVQSGELTATEADTAHLLAAGASFSPSAPEHEMALRATGSEEAVALLVYFQSGRDLPFPRDPAVHSLEVLMNRDTEAGIGCPCRLQLERLTLAPGTALPTQVADPLTWFVLDKGLLGLTMEGERLPYLIQPGEERTFSAGQYLPIHLAQPGTQMTLRNAGDDPLLLYRLTLTPGEAGAATATTPAVATAGPPSG